MPVRVYDAETAGGAVFVTGGAAAPEFFNNTFAANTSVIDHGGAIAIDGAMADIVNCLFHHNESPTLGAAVWTTDGSDVFIVNSTFANNIMQWDNCETGCISSLGSCHGAVYTAHCDDVMHVANCVFWNNHTEDGSGPCDASFSFGSVDDGQPNCDEFSDWLIEYSYFPESTGESHMGSGNVSNHRDPFIASNNDNYRINANSNQGLACIDTADNDLAVFDKWNMLDDPGWTYSPDRGKNPDLDLNPRVVRNHVDMGAFEHQFCVCPADLDGNGDVDGGDLAILLGSWETCSDCNNCPADLNLDCEVDGADLAILLASWGACPDCYEPEESSGGGGGELNGMGGGSFLEWLLYEATFAEILEWMASQLS